MLTLLSTLTRLVANRRAVGAMRELDAHVLADIGLLRADVTAALNAPLTSDPSRLLQAACCHWRALTGRPANTAPCAN
jgi:uncharacterized protein YjiS (DUF1127 family)